MTASNQLNDANSLYSYREKKARRNYFLRSSVCAAFEAVVDLISESWANHPSMHVYHYAPYEPAAFKRLMGRYSTREGEIDSMLRAELFVDLLRRRQASLEARGLRTFRRAATCAGSFERDSMSWRNPRISTKAQAIIVLCGIGHCQTWSKRFFPITRAQCLRVRYLFVHPSEIGSYSFSSWAPWAP